MPDHFAHARLTLEGYCPVTIVDRKQWIKGTEEFAVILDGRKYLFPDKARQQMFLRNTTKYCPALSGDCLVSYVANRARIAGSMHHTAIHKGRLYLFAGAREKDTFMRAPADYENAELAFRGLCSVCLIESDRQVPGKLEHGTIVGGMRYYFSDDSHRKQFLANKTKYLVPAEN